jgi:hypothetical protein
MPLQNISSNQTFPMHYAFFCTIISFPTPTSLLNSTTFHSLMELSGFITQLLLVTTPLAIYVEKVAFIEKQSVQIQPGSKKMDRSCHDTTPCLFPSMTSQGWRGWRLGESCCFFLFDTTVVIGNVHLSRGTQDPVPLLTPIRKCG